MKRVLSATSQLLGRFASMAFTALLMFSLTGCYTQLATVEHSDRTSASEEPVEEAYYGDSEEDAVWNLYEARRDGLVSRETYRDQLRLLGQIHYGDPWYYEAIFGDPFFNDPRYGIGISRVRYHFAFNRLERLYYYGGYGFYNPFFYDPFFHDPFFHGARFTLSLGFGFGRYRPYSSYYRFYSGVLYPRYRYGGYYGGYYSGYSGRYFARSSRRSYQPRGATVGRRTAETRTVRTANRGSDGTNTIGRSSTATRTRTVQGRGTSSRTASSRGTVGRSTQGARTQTGRSTGRATRGQRGRVGRSAGTSSRTSSGRGTTRTTQRGSRTRGSGDVARTNRFTPRTSSPTVDRRIPRIPDSKLAPTPDRERVLERIYRQRLDNRLRQWRERRSSRDRYRAPRHRGRSSSGTRSRSVRSRGSNRSSSRSVRSSSRDRSNSRARSSSNRSSSRSSGRSSGRSNQSGRGGN